MNEITYTAFETLTDKTLTDILSLETLIFYKPYSEKKIIETIYSNPDFFGQIAYSSDQPVGYILGYKKSSSLYYLWILGVKPENEGQGIGKQLLSNLEKRCFEKGYSSLEVRTEKKFKSAITFYTRSEFKVTDTYQREGVDGSTTVFQKSLISNEL
jgi:ribosomal protein S18 acetylase RimI-like enzyme